MAANKIFAVALLFAVRASAAGSPCTTAGPPPPPPPPASPCTTAAPVVITTVTTTPPPTATTVTTTPPATVTTTPGAVASPCTTAGPATTVTTTPATTVTTTPATTCASFTCAKDTDPVDGKTLCADNECTQDKCCTGRAPPCPTFTPPTTVTTTPPPPTCADYTCPKDYTNTGKVCSTGGWSPGCDKPTCCKANPTEAPSPCGTAAPPKATAPPASPCTTAAPAPRLYDAKEAGLVQKATDKKGDKKSSFVPAWAFPLLGAVAMFTFVAFVAVRVRHGKKSTRQLQMMQPVPQTDGFDEEAFLSDDALVE